MARPNFFCKVDALQQLLELDLPEIEPNVELSIDLIELPYLFLYTVDDQAWTMKVLQRGELYDHKSGSGIETALLRVDRTTGQGSGQCKEKALADNMAAFFGACQQLSRYIQKEKIQLLYQGMDPEQAGIMLETEGKKLKVRAVRGSERPELMCTTLFGGPMMMRPYMEDFWDRSETEMMSVEEKIEKAESGDKFAIAQLAAAYLDGDDEVEQDPEKAAYWYRKEAELGESEGAFNLGILYAKGFGVERDFTKAAEWMEKALAWGDSDAKQPAEQYRKMADDLRKAEAGDAKAMAEVAGTYMAMAGSLDQAGPDRDYAESLKWAQKAADAGCAAGYWPLALAYHHGRGVKKDNGKATELYKKGAELGDAACQHSYACRLINGEGMKKNPDLALKLFEKSAKQGYALAYRALGNMYETGEGVEPDNDKELEYYEKACQADPDNAELLRHVGYQYTNLLDGNDEEWLRGVERAAYWLGKAAELGDRTAISGARLYARILELHKQGKIPAGTSISDCMRLVSEINKAEENKDKEESEKREREPDIAEQSSREHEAPKKQKEEEPKRTEQDETIKAAKKSIPFDEHLSLNLPEDYRSEKEVGSTGKDTLKIYSQNAEKEDIRISLISAGKEAELEEANRNLNGNFHARVTAKLGEAQDLFASTHYFLAAVLFEYHKHGYVLTCYKIVQDREDLDAFAIKAADFLNEGLTWIAIDNTRAEMDLITAPMLLKLANAEAPADQDAADEEEKKRAIEQFQQQHPDGEGISVRAVYRDPFTGKMKRDLFWERAGAESGDPEAMIQMGVAYLNGDGVERDPEKACEYFRQAAEMDEPVGQYNMGLQCAKGEGVRRSFSEAIEWMTMARDNGDPDAEAHIKNMEGAAELEQKAYAGDAEAQARFSTLLAQYASENNLKESVRMAQLSVEQNCPRGYHVLGSRYEYGMGVDKDPAKAAELYKKGAELGSPECQYCYAVCLKTGSGVPQDEDGCLAWASKAAEQGHVAAAISLSLETANGSRPQPIETLIEYLLKAEKLEPDNARIAGQLAVQYVNLEPSDFDKAIYWYDRAAELGDAKAAEMARLYRFRQKMIDEGRLAKDTNAIDFILFLQSNGLTQEAFGWNTSGGDASQRYELEKKKRAAEWMSKYGQYLEKDPDIIISGSKFVFTGIGLINTQQQISAALEKMKEMGGEERRAVSGKTDYLVCDPRDAGESKVNNAIEQQRKGKSVKIVLMEDFLKALGMDEMAKSFSIKESEQDQAETEKEEKTEKTDSDQNAREAVDMDAALRLAQDYLAGKGIETDKNTALQMLEKAADQGNSIACKALGHMYEAGDVIEPDIEKELEYYEKACLNDSDDSEFLRHVGFQYINLLENEKTWLKGAERAAYWLRKAADRGDRAAEKGAEMYESILKLHRQGVIPLGASVGECMGYLEQNAAEEERRQNEREKEKRKEEKRKTEETERLRREEQARIAAEKNRQEEQRRKEEEKARLAAEEEKRRQEEEEARLAEEKKRKEAREINFEDEVDRERAEAEKRQAQAWLERYEKQIVSSPSFTFDNRIFVFSGCKGNEKADKLAEELRSRGASIESEVTKRTDYLICNPGCAGDVMIQNAVALQKKNGKPIIVLLDDLLHALHSSEKSTDSVQTDGSQANEMPKLSNEAVLSTSIVSETVTEAPQYPEGKKDDHTPKKSKGKDMAIFAVLIILLGAALFFGLRPRANKEAVEKGNIYYSKGNYTAAFNSYLRAAKTGDADAMGLVGKMYSEGIGTTQDYKKAFEWYLSAAKAGNERAMNNLGYCYYYGEGTAKNDSEAFKWYSKSAEAGDRHAMFNLGAMYEKGEGTAQSYEKAIEWYKKSADAGVSEAEERIKKLADSGIIGTDDKSAIDAMIKTGNKYYQKKEYSNAMEWYQKAADLGNAGAMADIGIMYNNGYGVSQDYTTALEWFQKAADLGNVYAMNEIGMLYYYGNGVSRDYSKAAEWWQKAADHGESSSMFNLGYLYEKGRGVPQDYKQALQWYGKAKEAGNEDAEAVIQELVNKGFISAEDAKPWLD